LGVVEACLRLYRARASPRSVGVFYSKKSPMVPQLLCFVILLVKRLLEEDDEDKISDRREEKLGTVS
jgi:hypothetical protein